MDEQECLRHSKCERKYHVVLIPKCGCKVMYGNLRRRLGEVFRQAGRAERVSDRGWASSGRPCAYNDLGPAEVFRVVGGGVHHGQECDTPGVGVWGAEAAIRGTEILGRRILCINSTHKQEDKRLVQLNIWR